jgi:hypothetical protein
MRRLCVHLVSPAKRRALRHPDKGGAKLSFNTQIRSLFVSVSIATPKATRETSAAPRPVNRAAVGGQHSAAVFRGTRDRLPPARGSNLVREGS